jgi:hypothetical protein
MIQNRLLAGVFCAVASICTLSSNTAGGPGVGDALGPPAPPQARVEAESAPATAKSQGVLELVRVFLSPPSIGAQCMGEFAVRNTGPHIAPDPRQDLFRADIEVRGKSGGVLFKSYIARAGTGIGHGEVIACKFSTQHNAAAPGPGVFPPFVIPAAGDYELVVTLSRTGFAKPLGSHVERFTVIDYAARREAADAAERAARQAAAEAKDREAGRVRKMPPPQAGHGPLRVAGFTVAHALTRKTCSGEFEVRNDGPDIRPGDDEFFARVEIYSDFGEPLFWSQMSRCGVGMRNGETCKLTWDSGSNLLDRTPGGNCRSFAPRAPGYYVARVTLSREPCRSPLDPQVGRKAPQDVRDVRFEVIDPALGAGAFAMVNPSPGPAPASGGTQSRAPAIPAPEMPAPPSPAARPVPPAPQPWTRVPIVAPPVPGQAPTALRILDARSDPVVAGQRLSGRFVVRNDSRDFTTPVTGFPPAWCVFVLDDRRRMVFHSSGAWGPGMRNLEEIEITWDSRTNELPEQKGAPFVLPRPGEYVVRIEVYAANDRVAILDSATYKVIVRPSR